LHSFAITDQDTALVTAYDPLEMDLTGVYWIPTNGWIWDSMFQEIDLETNELIFEWRASDHLDLRESYTWMNLAIRWDPWDHAHLNSVEKDSKGNYLVSSRHLRCVAYVDGKTGDVLWQLGGRNNSFTDLSDGYATTFTGQHDAHWAEEGKAITFFDNGADCNEENEAQSRGVRVEIDLDAMTAKLGGEYFHPAKLRSPSQGSYQTLPNGNVLLGYGEIPAITEFAPDGTPLCDAYFGPSDDFGWETVESYRSLSFNWTGLPKTTPSLLLKENALYVSWLGATEVRRWVLQDSFEKNGGDFDEVLRMRKTGIETVFNLDAKLAVRRYVRVLALDGDDKILETSEVIDLGASASWISDDDAKWREEIPAGSSGLLGHMEW
jgi:hypothetical protein